MNAPSLTFFCELDALPLAALTADGRTLKQLHALRARVAVALRDLSGERAAFIRALNDAGIPVTVWLVLEKEDGYFLHVDNHAAARARYEALQSFIEAHRLRVEGIGLDFEPDLRDIQGVKAEPHRVLLRAARRALHPSALRQAHHHYGALVDRMRTDGYAVESYQFPALLDERRAGSAVLQRAVGVMDLPVDREVLMLYSSLTGPFGLPLLWSYAPEADAIGVGSTGGGIDTLPKLPWEALERDLLIARRFTRRLYVFSLEGCADRGFLERLENFDWTQPAGAPPRSVSLALVARSALRGGLRATAWIERALRRGP